jgi:hypothetical protein
MRNITFANIVKKGSQCKRSSRLSSSVNKVRILGILARVGDEDVRYWFSPQAPTSSPQTQLFLAAEQDRDHGGRGRSLESPPEQRGHGYHKFPAPHRGEEMKVV